MDLELIETAVQEELEREQAARSLPAWANRSNSRWPENQLPGHYHGPQVHTQAQSQVVESGPNKIARRLMALRAGRHVSAVSSHPCVMNRHDECYWEDCACGCHDTDTGRLANIPSAID